LDPAVTSRGELNYGEIGAGSGRYDPNGTGEGEAGGEIAGSSIVGVIVGRVSFGFTKFASEVARSGWATLLLANRCGFSKGRSWEC